MPCGVALEVRAKTWTSFYSPGGRDFSPVVLARNGGLRRSRLKRILSHERNHRTSRCQWDSQITYPYLGWNLVECGLHCQRRELRTPRQLTNACYISQAIRVDGKKFECELYQGYSLNKIMLAQCILFITYKQIYRKWRFYPSTFH